MNRTSPFSKGGGFLQCMTIIQREKDNLITNLLMTNLYPICEIYEKKQLDLPWH